jgi:hypothetical protein
MKWIGLVLSTVAALAGVNGGMSLASGQDAGEAAPIYGIKIPAGYRDWEFITVKQLLIPGMTDQLRAQLGNEIAIKAFKEGKVPFPDGSIIAALHWTRIPAEADDKVLAGPFPGAQSFIVGSPVMFSSW